MASTHASKKEPLVERFARVVLVATAIFSRVGLEQPVIIDAWMQHHSEWIRNPIDPFEIDDAIFDKPT